MSKETITPVGCRVLVRRKAPKEKTEGGIILHEATLASEYGAETRGVILGFGAQAWEDYPGSECKVGDNVIIRKYSGAGVDTEKYGDILVNDADILARVG